MGIEVIEQVKPAMTARVLDLVPWRRSVPNNPFIVEYCLLNGMSGEPRDRAEAYLFLFTVGGSAAA
jgi:hypothetical protein